MQEKIKNPLGMNEDKLRNKVGDKAYSVLRQAATEAPFSGECETLETPGTYICRACGAKLFDSSTKFDAHCGWPAFYSPLAGDTVRYVEDDSLGIKRIEVRCTTCDSHLGHVFEGEGFNTPTDQRYCINSVALKFDPGEPDTSDKNNEKNSK